MRFNKRKQQQINKLRSELSVPDAAQSGGVLSGTQTLFPR